MDDYTLNNDKPLRRPGYTVERVCQLCHRKHKKGTRGFEVHHIVKRRNFEIDDPAANSLNNLVTLCPECHIKAEKGKIPVPIRLI